jgi:rare lipoprotein A
MTARRNQRARLAALLAGVLLLGACATAPAPDRAEPEAAPAATPPVRPAQLEPPAPHDGSMPDSTARPSPGGAPVREFQRGQASWYGPGFHGRKTASGERFDMNTMTAAHRTLPFGTLVRVRSLVTGKEIEVRVNDRGPFNGGRIIDLSRAAAEALGLIALGVKDVMLLVPEGAEAASRQSPSAVLQRRARRPAADDGLVRN